MFSIYYPTKDNIITDVTIRGQSKTGSNQGYTEILDLFVLPEASSSVSYGKSRALLYFNTNALSESIAAGDIPSSSVEYTLRLKAAPSHATQPSSFDLVVYPLSRSWDEGKGLSKYDEDLKDSGFSNWDNATSLVAWTLTGSDFITSISASQHFDSGDEDLEVDISDIVGQWLTGGIPNNGIVVKYVDAHETGSLELYVKNFYSRHSLRPDRRPRMMAKWTDVCQDDRNNIKYNVTGSLFYYRIINGFEQNAGGTVYCKILNSGSTVLQTITTSLAKTGIYEASGVFVTLTSSTQIYRDIWFTDNEQLFTGNFTPTFASGSDHLTYNDITLDVPNLRAVYPKDDQSFIRVFARPKDYRPAIRKSGSIKSSPTLLKEAFFEIRHESSNEVIVPFSTGSVKFSKLSYDDDGNYFELDTSNLVEDNLYRIRILADYNRQKVIFDKDWIIKVVG